MARQNKQAELEEPNATETGPEVADAEEGGGEEVEYNIERDQETKHLRCLLTDDEKLEFADKLTSLMYERESKQEEFDAIKKQFNGELSALDNEVRAKQKLVHDGFEYRSIECQVERNYNTNTFIVTRIDTGEIIEQRGLRPSELQRRMFKVKADQDAAAERREEEPVGAAEE